MDKDFMDLAAGMSAAHSLFESMIASGFTEDQALRLLAYMLAAQLSMSGEEQSNG